MASRGKCFLGRLSGMGEMPEPVSVAIRRGLNTAVGRPSGMGEIAGLIPVA